MKWVGWQEFACLSDVLFNEAIFYYPCFGKKWKICQHSSETLNNLTIFHRDILLTSGPTKIPTHCREQCRSKNWSFILCDLNAKLSALFYTLPGLRAGCVFQFCVPCVLTMQYIIQCKDVARCNLPRGMCMLEHAKRSEKNIRMLDLHALRSEIDEKRFKS